MDKVYLVLRNNQQSGPFTIGELLQQQLKPSDMIWIEGKSTAWTYLSELELAPFVKLPSDRKEEKDLKRSADEIERKAEELRQRVLSSAPKTYLPKYRTEIETYASPYKLGDNEIEFVDHRKERVGRRNTVLGEFVVTCFVIGLFIVGIYKGKSFLGTKKQVAIPAATQLNTNDAHSAQKMKPLQPQPMAVMSDTIKNNDSSSVVAFHRPRQSFAANKNQLDSSERISEPAIELPQIVPNENKTEAQNENKTEAQKENKTEAQIKLPEEMPVKKEIILPPVKKEANANTETQEEKKGFLKGIFKKKKKEQDKPGKSEDKEG